MATIRQLVPLSSDALSGVSINATRAGYLGNTNSTAGTVNASACIVTNSSKGITGMGSITSTSTITANTITDGVASLSGGTLSGATIVSPNLTSPTFASCTINGSITGNAIDTISFSGFNYRVASSELIEDSIAAGDAATLSSAYAYTDTHSKYAHYQWREPNGTSGGTATTGSWTTVNLTHEVSDTIGITGPSSNRITIPAGTYYFEGNMFFDETNNSRLSLANITSGVFILQGMNVHAGKDSGNLPGATAIVRGCVTLAITSVLELQYYCSSNNSAFDLGYPLTLGFGTSEIYADLFIRKLA